MEEDLKTIESVWSGDKEAFGALYEKYSRKIHSFVSFRVSSKEIAEDLISDIFFKALNGLLAKKFSGGNFQAWLYRLARNRVIDHYRARRADAPLAENENLDDRGVWEENVALKMRLDEVKKYLNGLKGEQKEIIVLRVWDELSYREIAAITGKSEAAAKMAFKRALENLRAVLPADLLVLWLILINLK